MISVVVPAYNEEDSIGSCLNSLVKQKTKEKFEVIVVDNNSTDKTVKIAKTFAKKLDLKIIKESRQGRGAARATGFSKAEGEIVLSLDSDTFAPFDWIEKMTSGFKERGVVAVTGPWKALDLPFLSRVFVNNFQEIFNLPFRILFGAYWLTGLNFGIRKKIYERAGGFNRNLNAHEDIDLSLRIRRFGKIKYSKAICVLTSGRRYKDGIVSGLWSYQKPGLKLFLLGERSIKLEDRR